MPVPTFASENVPVADTLSVSELTNPERLPAVTEAVVFASYVLLLAEGADMVRVAAVMVSYIQPSVPASFDAVPVPSANV